MFWKKFLVVIVLNIFLVMFYSVMHEHSRLNERFTILTNTVSTALDSAVNASTGSEEFFSDKFQAQIMSYASTTDDVATYASTVLWLEGDKTFCHMNTFLLAYFYEQNGRLPKTRNEVDSMTNIGTSGLGQSAFLYHWLFGASSSAYNDGALSWANRNTAVRDQYDSLAPLLTPRTGFSASNANSNFYTFYNEIGSKQQTVSYLKKSNGDGSFDLEAVAYPTLANMGFDWMHEYNQTSSMYTSDTLSSTIHVGKALNGSRNTYYYLTPASLGVTYVPMEVLKPTFLANLDTVARLNKVSGGTLYTASSGAYSTELDKATGCMFSDIYNSGSDTPIAHEETESIINDGVIEYDLSSVKLKVDYFYVNLGDSSLRSLSEKLMGSVSGLSQQVSGNTLMLNEADSRSYSLDLFTNQDSSNNVEDLEDSGFKSLYSTVKDGRIIARVSVRMKVHIPYQSRVMQWACKALGTKHFDIKSYDSQNGRIVTDSDGTWFECSTYYCQSRV